MEASIAHMARWPLAGVVVTLMAVLAHWGQNQLRLGIESAWPTLVSVAALAALITGAFLLLCGSWARAAASIVPG